MQIYKNNYKKQNIMSNIINKALLSLYSPLPSNYDYSEIMNYVPVAQEIWIRPLIGDDLMNELEEQVKNNNLSEANQALMTEGFLLQYLSYATCLEGLVFIWSHFSQTGISLGKSDNSNSITLKDLTYIESHLRKTVEYLKERVKKYICERPNYFPQVCQCDCECGCAIKPKLSKPNPYQQLYSTNRKNTDLR